jgi:hypothetical protein
MDEMWSYNDTLSLWAFLANYSVNLRVTGMR